MSAFTDFIKKASDAISNLRGGSNFFLGKDGDIVYSKNNVCVHDQSGPNDVDNVLHTPGYLTVHCQSDDAMGISLVLQWLPNTTLHRNPASIRSVSPRNPGARKNEPLRRPIIQESQDRPFSPDNAEDDTSIATSTASADINVEMHGDVITVTAVHERPKSLVSQANQKAPGSLAVRNGGLGVPSIAIIPNTPVDTSHFHESDEDESAQQRVAVASGSGGGQNASDNLSQSSLSTSGADEFSDVEDLRNDSSCDDDSEHETSSNSLFTCEPEYPSLDPLRLDQACRLSQYRESLLDTTPEQFAMEHDLMLMETKDAEESIAVARGRAMYSNKSTTTSLFSVNLGLMRSMRLFFSNPECTCGQLVIASNDSHYKILHFHHGGLDKLAQLFEQWSAIKAKTTMKDGSPTAVTDKLLLICHPAVSKSELDPEDGLYDRVSWDYWKSYRNAEGAVDDSTTIRKAIFFASMEPGLRREIWPFLLRVYPWESTLEQRETIRNDLFLQYQSIRTKRLRKANTNKQQWSDTENTIVKDVVRTDRKNPFYAGDENHNIDTMRDILLNYAAAYPDVNYIQGMSDLLAPLLSMIRNEADSYWCFHGLMQQTVFSSSPDGNENLMETNLEYLRELLKLLTPDFYQYLKKQKEDAMQLMFVHRWILLFFKREFPEMDALHIWEACWSRYRTNYFHLFVCVAIVHIYGGDVIAQQLPHDEILLYFSSLAMHMDARVVLKKARGLLHEFSRRERLPCSLAGILSAEVEQWDTHRQILQYECTQAHGINERCPYAAA